MIRHQVAVRALTLCIMLVFFGQLCFGATQLSLTSDEPAHVANGYAILTTRDFWSVPYHGHPPLVNVWTAWPLLLQQERPNVSELPGWHENLIRLTRDLWRTFGSLDRLAYVTRYPNMLLALVLLALVVRWSSEWHGAAGGLLALLLMSWDPTMIAHAQLNTTDLGFALLAFVTFYLCWKLQRRFSYLTLVGIGLTSGAAMGAKASGIVIPPLVALLFSGYYLVEVLSQGDGRTTTAGDRKARMRQWLRPGLNWASYSLCVLLLSGLVIWAAYGFSLRPLPFAVHLEMLRIFFEGQARLAFANGELRVGGWWWYFPFATVIKTPLPLMLAYGLGLVWALADPGRLFRRDLALWLFPGIYLLAALVSDVNIGYRHLLPIFPFLYVNTSRIAGSLRGSTGRIPRYVSQPLSVLLGVWYVLGTALVYPFPIAYFNELVGGAKNGYRYLVDSNVDWGQSFKALKSYMDLKEIPRANISYFTWIDPGAYGIHYTPLFPGHGTESYMPRRYDPAPGVYAISATTLQGIALKEHDPDLYEWFRHRVPDAQPGYGLLVYEVRPHDPPATWLAQCSVPVAPFDDTAIREGFGRDDLRRVTFDCTQAWILPGAGQTHGWYALYHETWAEAAPFVRARLAPTRLSYEQARSTLVTAFTLFEWQGIEDASEVVPPLSVVAAPIGWPPAQAEVAGEMRTTPVELGETLSLLHYEVVETPKDGVLEVWTTWLIRDVPTRPLSLIGHLLGADERPVAVSDGLGVEPSQWQPGDVIVQRHAFTLPPELAAGTYWLQTGAYWLDTLDRLPVTGAPPDYDRLLLTEVEIK
jgi:hypothetical protein